MPKTKRLSLKERWDLCVSCAQYVLEDRSERGGELGEVEMAESAQEMSHHILEIERIITGKKVKVRPKKED